MTPKVDPPKPFILEDGIAPIPASVVKKIQALEFVDFSELMPNNRELLRRMEVGEKPTPPPPSKTPLRRVTNVTTWAQCFMAYAAILLSKYPDKLIEVMAYGKMILKEAARHGGDGWKVYDTLFRQMLAADKTIPWSKLNPTIYATTFLAMRDTHAGAQCSICIESDHKESECELATDQQQTVVTNNSHAQTGPKLTQRKYRSTSTRVCRAFNFSSCALRSS